MTKEEVKKLLPLMQAYADGKKIEYYSNGYGWNIINSPDFNDDIHNYRIKPELKLKYRPFTYDEFLLLTNRWIKRKEDKSETLMKAIMINHYKVVFGYNTNISYKELLENYTFADNSPCGKLMENE